MRQGEGQTPNDCACGTAVLRPVGLTELEQEKTLASALLARAHRATVDEGALLGEAPGSACNERLVVRSHEQDLRFPSFQIKVVLLLAQVAPTVLE